MKGLFPRDKRVFLTETHFYLSWVHRIVSHPRVLNTVESVLGPNIMVSNSHWFPKFPGDKAFVSWHQDATYWGLSPANVTTAWVALSESTPQNGCLRVVPGSHRPPLLPQRETYAADNMLSRGQEIALEVDDNHAVDLPLRPGHSPFTTSASSMDPGLIGRTPLESDWPFATFRPTLFLGGIWSCSFAARMNTETSRSLIRGSVTWPTARARVTAKLWSAKPEI